MKPSPRTAGTFGLKRSPHLPPGITELGLQYSTQPPVPNAPSTIVPSAPSNLTDGDDDSDNELLSVRLGRIRQVREADDGAGVTGLADHPAEWSVVARRSRLATMDQVLAVPESNHGEGGGPLRHLLNTSATLAYPITLTINLACNFHYVHLNSETTFEWLMHTISELLDLRRYQYLSGQPFRLVCAGKLIDRNVPSNTCLPEVGLRHLSEVHLVHLGRSDAASDNVEDSGGQGGDGMDSGGKGGSDTWTPQQVRQYSRTTPSPNLSRRQQNPPPSPPNW